MKCNQIEFLMPLYLSSELDASGLTDFEDHLHSCRVCATKLDEARQHDDLLRAALGGPSPNTEKTRKRVLDQIRKSNRRRFLVPRLVFTMPIAAVLLLAISAGVYVLLRGSLTTTVYAAAQNDHYIEVVERADRPWLQTPEEIRAFVQDELGNTRFLDQLTPSGYHLTRALHCYLLKQRYVHLVYENGSREISIFVRPRDAELPGSTVEIANGCALHAAAVNNFEIAGFQSRQYRVLVVSDLSRGETLQVARMAAVGIAHSES